MKIRLLVLLLTIQLSSVGFASTAIIKAIPNAEQVGSGVFKYGPLSVYRASLFAPNGAWSSDQPYGLSLSYSLNLKGKAIAERSIQEMRKQGFIDSQKLAQWNAQMIAIFPDVTKGTVLSAVYLPGKQTTFYNGNTAIGSIKDDQFGRWFFNIWLSEKTSAPKLRQQLLSLN